MRTTGVPNAPACGARRLPRAALLAVVAAALSLLLSARAEAYPSMVKHGYSACGTCHADPSGGELLTPYGRALSSVLLSTEWPRKKPATKPSPPVASPKRAAPKPVPPAPPAAAAPVPAQPVMTPAGAPPPAEPASSVEPSSSEPPSPAAPSATPAPAPALETSTPAPPATSPGGAGVPPGTTEPTPAADANDNASAAGDPVPPPPAAPTAEGEATTPGEPAAASQTPPSGEEPAAEAVPEPPVAAAEPEPEFEADSSEQAEESIDDAEESEEPGPFSEPFFGLFGNPERVLLGGSLRLASLLRPSLEGERARFFPMQVDLYGQVSILTGFSLGGSLGVAKVPEGSLHARAAQITSNQGDGYNLISRTHYARLDFADGAHSVRVGRLNLPYGVRISEHVMWVREQTQTDRESDQQHGVALAMSFAALRFEVMGVLGNYQVEPDYYRERGYSAYAEYTLFSGAAVGLSSLVTTAADDLTSPSNRRTTRQAHGATLRAALSEDLVVLAEADVLLRSRRAAGYVGMVQLDFELLRGVHALATGEILDAGAADGSAALEGAGKPRTGGWLSAQWFFLPHFDLRIDGIARHSEPFQLLTQLHVYL